MAVTITRIDGDLAAEWPGASAFTLGFVPERGRLVITCPLCRKRTARDLVEGESFEIRHRRRCWLSRTLRRLVAQYPERVGQSYGTLMFQRGGASLVVRDSMPLQGDELDADKDAVGISACDGASDGMQTGRRRASR